MGCKTILSTLTLAVTSLSLNAAVIHVVPSPHGGTEDGTSWTTAYSDLSTALNTAFEGDEVWVKAGTYKPDPSDRSARFYIVSGVELYGGFNGTELSRTDRNYKTNATILSGDIGVEGDDTDNTYTIVDLDNGILDGVTIKDGNSRFSAGGCSADGLSVTISNCTFENNKARYNGGALDLSGVESSAIILKNCLFEGNSAGANGGAIYVSGSGVGTLKMEECRFTRNDVVSTTRSKGGAVCSLANLEVNIINCIFDANDIHTTSERSYTWGGGLYIESAVSVNISNSTFGGNSASDVALNRSSGWWSVFGKHSHTTGYQ